MRKASTTKDTKVHKGNSQGLPSCAFVSFCGFRFCTWVSIPAPTAGKVAQTLPRSSAGNVPRRRHRSSDDRRKAKAAALAGARTCHSSRLVPCWPATARELQLLDNSQWVKIQCRQHHRGL